MGSLGSEESQYGKRGAEHLAHLLNRSEQLKHDYYCRSLDNAIKVSNKQVRAEANLVRSRAHWLHSLSAREGQATVLSFKPKARNTPDAGTGVVEWVEGEGTAEQSTFISWMNHREYSKGSLTSKSGGSSRGRKKQRKKQKSHGSKVKTEAQVSVTLKREPLVTFSEDKGQRQLKKPFSKSSGGLMATVDSTGHNRVDLDCTEGKSVFLTEFLPDIGSHKENGVKGNLPDLDHEAELESPSLESLKLPAIVTQSVGTTHTQPAERLPKRRPKQKPDKSQEERIAEFLLTQQQFNKEHGNYQSPDNTQDILQSQWFMDLLKFISSRNLPNRKIRKTKYTVFALQYLGIPFPGWD